MAKRRIYDNAGVYTRIYKKNLAYEEVPKQYLGMREKSNAQNV